MLSIIISWTLCAILTVSGAVEPDSPVRTDSKLHILHDAPWFRVPYPCTYFLKIILLKQKTLNNVNFCTGQWGIPTVSVGGVFGMFAGVIASAMESIGDYYACARLANARPPPVHAINRGVAMEGIGCVLAGLWGSGNGSTSYSENIGAIGVTKVGSRRIVQCAGLIMIFFGVMAKFGALLVSIPEPVIGGIFCVMFSMITATGLSNLKFVDLSSTRNLLVFGLSLFLPLVIFYYSASIKKFLSKYFLFLGAVAMDGRQSGGYQHWIARHRPDHYRFAEYQHAGGGSAGIRFGQYRARQLISKTELW